MYRSRIILTIFNDAHGNVTANHQNKSLASLRGFYFWWALADLNRGPKDYESSALTS